MKRELRLALQVFLLLIAQFVLFLYMTFINVYASQGDAALVVKIKMYTPLANGLLSFFNPFTTLLCNKELLRRIKKMIRGQKTEASTDLSNGASVVSPWTFTFTRKKLYGQSDRLNNIRGSYTG
uniref:Uncharacterized protein n=1 Tax=Caenorhabditis japonica TaxID=281687 RepID=A0A8R1E2L9_CAEJA